MTKERLKEIEEIREFPSGHFYHKGKFTRYYSYPKGINGNSEEKIKKDLKNFIEEAVQKRVQTELPIGVFLSGGVDSSLIMELAIIILMCITTLVACFYFALLFDCFLLSDDYYEE